MSTKGSRFQELESPSTFRRMASAMWGRPNDPSIYGSLDIDVTRALELVRALREQSGVHVTMTHLVARAMAIVLAENPEVNAKVRFWGKLEQRTSVDVFLTVASEGGRDLGGIRIDGADRKSIVEIARAVKGSAEKVREGKDERYQKSRSVFKTLPWWLVRPTLRLSDWLTNELHFDLPDQGMPLDPFGSVLITNVGMFGIDTAFAPFVPISRVPMLILLTEVRDRPWVEPGRDGARGELVVRPVLRLCATFDHRIIDGFKAGKIAGRVSALLSAPEQL